MAMINNDVSNSLKLLIIISLAVIWFSLYKGHIIIC